MPTVPTAEPVVREKIKPKTGLPEPHLFKVIYMNDEVTTMEFVVESLMNIFNHSPEDAEALMTKIHEEGSAVVAILPYELAEQKGVEATIAARNQGYPLMVRLEPNI